MSVRAAWHTADLDVGLSDDDPFGDGPRRIEDVGTPVPLADAGGVDDLRRRLTRTLVTEGQLAEQGVTCAIKAVNDASCFACPLYREDDSPEAQLCAIGRVQERLCTELVVAQRGGRR
jgi:hypothetical protein